MKIVNYNKLEGNPSITNNTKTFYLIRHGNTLVSTKRYLGQADVSLNNTGLKQAKNLQKYFSFIIFDKIYSSTLKRAMQTAQIISHGRNVKIEYAPELREINLGKWDGLTFSEVRIKYPHQFYMRGANLKYYRPPGGESFSDLKIRVLKILTKIFKQTKKKAILITHAGVIRIIIASILDMSLNNIFQIKQDYGAINKILVKEKSITIAQTNFIPINNRY